MKLKNFRLTWVEFFISVSLFCFIVLFNLYNFLLLHAFKGKVKTGIHSNQGAFLEGVQHEKIGGTAGLPVPFSDYERHKLFEGARGFIRN